MTIKMTVQGLSSFGRNLQARSDEIAAAVRRENAARLAEAVQPREGMSVSMDESKRPETGLGIEDALERWSYPSDYQVMKELRDAEHLTSNNEVRHREYDKVREKLEEAQRRMLLAGKLVASGISRYANGRRAIESTLWDVLEVHYYFNEIAGEGHRYSKPQIFDPAAIPKNIDPVPDWLLKLHVQAVEGGSGLGGFQVKANYRLIICRGKTYRPGPVQGTVLRLLHQAALSGDPLQDGKKLLAEAGAEGRRMQDVFKKASPVSELVESMGNGLYRLKL